MAKSTTTTTIRPQTKMRAIFCFLVGSAAALAPQRHQSRPANGALAQPHPSALEALTLTQDLEESPIVGSKQRMPRRLFRNVFRRSNNVVTPPSFSAVALPSIANNTDASFILRDYETLSPSQVLGPEFLGDNALDDVLTTGPDVKSRTRLLGKFAESTLSNLFDRWSNGSHKNLKVQCDPSGGVVNLVKGQFGVDAVVEFDQLRFPPIQFSSGKLRSHGMVLNYLKYAPFCKGIRRFRNSFDLEAQDVTLTQSDLFESPSIRSGLRRLLTRILHNRGMKASKVEITSIYVLPSGKVSCSGYATVLGSKVDFEVRSGLGVTSRGHVLTFPGLEISVGPAVGLFVPVVPPITLDIGHNAKITKIHCNGQKQRLELSCRATITPRHTRKQLKYSQTTNAFAASFHFDVGRWLTRIGNFSD